MRYDHPHDIEDGRPVVLIVGKKSMGKGTPTILHASRRVVAAIPDVLFVFIGKGEVTEEWPWIVNQPHQRGTHAWHMWDWYDACRIVCHAPDSYDSFPRAVLDAKAYARGVVGTDAPGGMRELIEHGYNGYLVPRGNPEALGAALITALDVEEAIRLGWNNYRSHSGQDSRRQNYLLLGPRPLAPVYAAPPRVRWWRWLTA